jgi:hypothetical protein
MKAGSRLSIERAVVSKAGIVVDGPFSEAKELSAATGLSWLAVWARRLNSPHRTRAPNSDSVSRFAPLNRSAPPPTT